MSPEICRPLRQGFCPARQRAQHVPRHGPPARNLRHHAGAFRRGAQYRHGFHQAQRADHRPHQPGERDALLPRQPHHSRSQPRLDRRSALPPRRLVPAATTSRLPKRPRCVSPKPSPATPTPSPTSSLPSCAASTPKAKSSSCSAPSASSTTSTASTMRSKWSRPSPAKAAAIRRKKPPATASRCSALTPIAASDLTLAPQEFAARMKLQLPSGTFGAYLFDCDGTIVDSMPLHYIAWKQALGEWGCTFDEDLFYSWGGKPACRNHRRAEPDAGPQHARRSRRRAQGESLLRTSPGAQTHSRSARAHRRPAWPHSLCRRLRQHAANSIVKSLTTLGLLDRFSILVGSDDYEHSKPAPDAFLTAAARLGIAPKDCLVFEDTDMGIQAQPPPEWPPSAFHSPASAE